MELTKTKNLLLDYDKITDTFYVVDLNTTDIIFKYYDLGTLKNWATTKYDVYTREELQQIIGDATTFITEQYNGYRNLLDTVFQKDDNNNGSQI